MPFMRSESCSFIWQPKVVTWKDGTPGSLATNCACRRGAKFGVGRLGSAMRNSTAPADRHLAELAARQHGVVSVGQLEALGLDGFAVRRRAESGRLHRLYRGVYSV